MTENSYDYDFLVDEILNSVEEEKNLYGGTNANDDLKRDSSLRSNDILTALNSNEDGDARLFIAFNKDKLCFDHSSEEWYVWNGDFWKVDKTGEVYAGLEKVIDEYYKELLQQSQFADNSKNEAEKKRAGERVKLLRTRINSLQTLSRKNKIIYLAAQGKDSLGITGEEWDRHPTVLGCENGCIDLTTGEFRESRPEDYIKTVAPVEWEGIDAPAPTWEQFWLDVFENDEGMVNYMQRLLGYAITGLVTEHVMPIFWGPNGRNGKSTTFEILYYILGPMARAIKTDMLTVDTFKRSPSSPSPEIMSLRGLRIAVASEFENNDKLALAKVKNYTGGDSLVGRPLYGKRDITFNATHKIFLITNHRPQISSVDPALWERIQLIPFNVSFVDNPIESIQRKRNPNLLEELKKEASGILAWLVRGSVAWFKDGLQPPDAVRATTSQYKKEEDSIGRFLDENVESDSKGMVKASHLYNDYKLFCANAGYSPVNNNDFSLRVAKSYQKVKRNSGNYYTGLSLIY